MKLEPVTVTFAGVTLTEAPHGVADLSGRADYGLDVFALSGAASGDAYPRGGDSMPLSFAVVRSFASPAAAGHFARTHAAALKTATGLRGNLDFAGAAGTSRMTGAALQSIQFGGAPEFNRVVITYSFIGPPMAPVA